MGSSTSDANANANANADTNADNNNHYQISLPDLRSIYQSTIKHQPYDDVCQTLNTPICFPNFKIVNGFISLYELGLHDYRPTLPLFPPPANLGYYCITPIVNEKNEKELLKNCILVINKNQSNFIERYK